MKSIVSLTKKWREYPLEKKIITGWIFSFIVVVSISSILYLSKQDIHQSSDVILLNSELRHATQDLLSAIQKLEIASKSYLITGTRTDSSKYFADLDSLQKNLKRLERLINNHPKFVKYFLPLDKTIHEKLYRINHLSFSLKRSEVIDLDIIRIEDNIYKKLNNYWQLLDDEEEQFTIEQIQVLNARMNKNLNYFFLLIVVYISILTFLFYVIITDAKKRRKLALEIAENRNELDSILNTAPAFIFVKNLEKKFTLVNKSFLDFFKTDSEKILQSDNNKLISTDDKWLADEEDHAVIHNKIALNNIERKIQLPDGRLVWLNINKAPLYNQKNEIVGIVGVMDDITQRVEYNEKLIFARKELEKLNNQKDKFFSIISHDLRSPFNGILGILELLIDEYSTLTPEEIKSDIDGIYKSLKDLLTLIDNLLTWSRMNMNRIEFQPIEISLNEIVDSVFKSLNPAAANKNINLHSELHKDLRAIADSDMIETVIRNLVTNAIKFTRPNGVVTVKASVGGEFVKVEIADNGVGMKKEIAENLFSVDKHTSTQGTGGEKGTGIGLIICKEFVEKHGGKIYAESELGNGSKFIFTIPFTK